MMLPQYALKWILEPTQAIFWTQAHLSEYMIPKITSWTIFQ